MRSDQEIERQLEDWLEEEARPMPHEVLEGALEAVARTPQAGARHGGPRWLGSRPMGMLGAAAVLVLVVVAGGLAVDRIGSLFPTESGGAGTVQVWDPVADWRSAPDQQNPSPDSYGNPAVWSYLRSTSSRHEPTTYILMPNHESDWPGFLREAWSEPAMTNVVVAVWPSDAVIYLHPTSGVHTILAWTSPVAGEVTIDGVVARPQNPCEEPSDGLIFSVDRSSDTLETIGLDLGQRTPFNLTTTVDIGDTVYFVADSDGDANCDLTQLQVTIRLSP
jgi:hypothetical protein